VQGADSSGVQEQVRKLTSPKGYGALYYPWINIQDPGSLSTISVPPSGAIAGLYTRSDITQGVEAAPANMAVTCAVSLEKTITKSEQDALDLSNINVIRFFSGRGYLVWGARTISQDSLWKYVNVRRLCMNIEESIYMGTQWTVFEPDNETLWARMTATVNNFLYQMWKNQVLQGSKPEEAYFVKCDRTTMTQSDIDNGLLICLFGVSPMKPAEFIALRVSHQTNRP
jgi:phage tail sheath protein FI